MDLLVIGVLLFLGIGFVLGIVIALTRGLFARDLTRALKRVAQQAQELQAKADILEQRLNQQEKEYQLRLKRADAESERIVQEAKQQAMNIRAAAIEEAKHRARQLFLEAEQNKSQLKVGLSREFDSKAAQRACASLQSLLGASELNALHSTLVAELLEKLGQIDVSLLHSDAERIELRTAKGLSLEQSQRLAKWVANLFGSEKPLHITEDPSMVAGCVVHVG